MTPEWKLSPESGKWKEVIKIYKDPCQDLGQRNISFYEISEEMFYLNL